MVIVPKLAENETRYMAHDGVVEIQMLDSDLVCSLDRCRSITDAPIIFYHLPFGMHDLVYFTKNDNVSKLTNFVTKLDVSREFVIAHVGVDPKLFYAIGGYELLHAYASAFGIHWFLENSIASPNAANLSQDWAWQIATELGLHTVCDVTHLRASEYLYGVEQNVPVSCNYIHFASCRNRDGVRDKSTHGRVHESYSDMVNDLVYLGNKGIDVDASFICTEVSEADYTLRPEQRQELCWLRRYKHLQQIGGIL